jgi:outer membrane lipoprotein-sorting protein
MKKIHTTRSLRWFISDLMRPVSARSIYVLAQALSAFSLLGQASYAAEKTVPQSDGLTVEQIIERTREASKETGQGDVVFKFYRKASFDEFDANGNVVEKNSKTYRAYTDDRDQELRKVNGRPATKRERYREYKKHQERQRRYLNKRKEGDPKRRNENLVTRNVDLFEDKFAPKLVGAEKVNGRDAYVISLKPNKKYKHKSRIVNRIMDQLDTRVWVDKEEFQISQLSTRLLKPVNFLVGLAGAIKTINVAVTQKRLAKNTWVDEKVNAHFDARIVWKTYQFRMESLSTDFERTERAEPES